MLRRSLSTLLIMTTMGASTLALSDPHGEPDDGRNDGRGRGHDTTYYEKGQHDKGQHEKRGGEHGHALQGQHSRGPDAYGPQGHGPQTHGPYAQRGDHGPAHWQAHDRLPARYLNDRHAVRDWHRYDLPAPPPHHRWVKVDGEFILVAAATGVIASILLGRH